MYRKLIKCDDLQAFRIKVKESDIMILATHNLEKTALEVLLGIRKELENYIAKHPIFLKSLIPIKVEKSAPQIAKLMAEYGKKAKVGPMAAVAGAIAELLGKELLKHTDEVIVENGGDIFIHTRKPRTISIYAGNSPLSGKIGIRVPPGTWGIATSSGTIGHSLSLGKADAAVVISSSSALSDAFATALGNLVKTPQDIEPALKWISTHPQIKGALVILEKHLGAWGKVELVKINNEQD